MLADAEHPADGGSASQGLLYRLRLHAEFHFKRQEHLQALAGVPALAEHAAEHRDMLGEHDDLLEEIEALPPDTVVPDIRTKKSFLYHWFLHHLLDTDQMIKPGKARGLARSAPGALRPIPEIRMT